MMVYSEMSPLEIAADALRKYEQERDKLDPWNKISRLERRKWETRAQTVISAYAYAYRRREIEIVSEAKASEPK
jgi:hypothetical protein